MKSQSEQELAQHFVNYFADQDLYFEVPAGGIIDIMMLSGNIRTAIEVKTTFNFGVLEQAIKNKQYAHYSYIAVPETKKRWFQENLCKDYGVGLLEYRNGWNNKPEITEVVKPRLNRRIYKVKLEQYHKESLPGCQHGRITAFGNYVKTLKDTLRRKPHGATFKEVFEMGFVHYSSVSVFKSCLSKHIAGGIVKGVRVENGLIYHDKTA